MKQLIYLSLALLFCWACAGTNQYEAADATSCQYSLDDLDENGEVRTFGASENRAIQNSDGLYVENSTSQPITGSACLLYEAGTLRMIRYLRNR
jgi:hypothetical protein